MSTSSPSPLAQVTGANCRRIRTEIAVSTQDRLAREAARVGLPWTAPRVAQFESGGVGLALPTLVLLAAALDRLTPTSHPVTLASLLASESPIELSPGVVVTGAALAGVVRGGAASSLIADDRIAGPGESSEERRVDMEYGRADARVAAQLGLSKTMMMRACARLWGHAMSVERDRRAGPGADRRRAGLITRELVQEIEAEADSWAEDTE